MHKAILMHADIDESTELSHVCYHPFKHHAHLHIRNSANLFTELRGNEFVAWVAARLAQFNEDVFERIGAHTESAAVNLLEQLRLSDEIVHTDVEDRSDLFDNRVRLRMHSRHIQRVVSIADA